MMSSERRTRSLLVLLLLPLLIASAFAVHVSLAAEPGPAAQLAQVCPDPYEQNGGFSSAWPIQPGMLQSYICAPSDSDYFGFAAQAGELLRVDLYNLPIDCSLCLYDPQQEIMQCSNNAGIQPESIQVQAKMSGTHYVKVLGVQGAYSVKRPYTLELRKGTNTPTRTATATRTRTPTRTRTATPTSTRTETPGCDDPYEINNKCEVAFPVVTGIYHAYICPRDDEDWFSIDLLRPQSVSIAMVDPPKDYDLELYNPLGTLVASSHNAGIASEEITFEARELAGRYCLRVYGVVGANDPSTTYELKIDLGKPPEPTSTRTPSATLVATATCVPDAYEPNDSFVGAASIPVGSEIRAQLCSASDRDYFRFSASACSEMHVRLYDLPANYNLAILDPSGAIVSRAGGAGTSDRELSYVAIADGEYGLRVTAGSGAAGMDSYALRVNLAPAEPIVLYPTGDAYIFEGAAGSNFGAERLLAVGADEFGQRYRSLLRFDLSGVPHRPISSARLVLHLQDVSGHDRPSIEARQVLFTWNEGTLAWLNQPGSNALSVSTEVGPTASVDYSWDVTDLVQRWIDGDAFNFGLELRYSAEGADSRRYFSSRDAGSHQPRLIISCEPGAGGAPGSISGTLYEDANRNSTQEGGEPGIGGVRIDLVRRDWGYVASTTTSADGNYAFTSVAADGGAAVYDVTADETTIDIVSTYEWLQGPMYVVYMSPGFDFSDVNLRVARRPTPTPRPTPRLDLTTEDIEFIQVLADEPLVKGKHTLVRVYVGVTGAGGTVRGVSGRLYSGLDYILPLAPADLSASAFANPRDDPAVVSDLSRTLNFLLPDAWTQRDRLHVLAWVNYANPGDECGGCWNSENQDTADAFFRDASAHEVTMVSVISDGTPPAPSRADTYRWMLNTYPISEIRAHADSMSISGYNFTAAPSTAGRCNDAWSDLVSELGSIEVFGSAGGSEEGRYYGMVDSSVPHDGHSGCGRTPGTVAAGIVTSGSDNGGRTMAHETGHNLGLGHTCCSGEGSCDTHHPGGTLGRYGIDMSNPSVPVYLDPATNHDIMTYCASRWPADHTYSSLLQHFAGSPGVAAERGAVGAAQSPYIVGLGHIDDGQVDLTLPYYILSYPTGSHDEPGEGRYTIELQDADGLPLFSRSFDTMGDSVDPAQGSGAFRQIVPWQQGTARIVIKEGEQVLHMTLVSEHAPTVTLTAPNGGEHWLPYDGQTITWSGWDQDGNALRYVVEYSADDGATWQALATNLSNEAYTVDVGRLAGSETARIRVIASDGVNTALDASDGVFMVEGKPPEVSIIYPLDGATFGAGVPVVLEAAGTDAEDGPLTDDAVFHWASDRDGDLGQGRELLFTDLQAGQHTITVTVSDGEGYRAEDHVSILIGYPIYLAMVR